MTQDEDQNLESLKRRVFELCLAIYRLTKLFPQGEVLVSQLRETSIKIIVLLAANKISDTIKKVEEIRIYLAVSCEQNWVKPINFKILLEAYDQVDLEILKFSPNSSLCKEGSEMNSREKLIATPPPENKKNNSRKNLLEDMKARKSRIIDYFNQNRAATMLDLIKILGKVSARTVRNDLSQLVDKNVIKKVGNTRTSYYVIN